jgi:hypothetical protein
MALMGRLAQIEAGIDEDEPFFEHPKPTKDGTVPKDAVRAESKKSTSQHPE